MIIGVPKEIKDGEYRVSLMPLGVEQLVAHGHEVLVEEGAGLRSGAHDQDYVNAGARIIEDKLELFQKSEMIVKVKEILPSEFEMLQENQIIFTYIHSANRPGQTQALLDKKVIAIAYEDIKLDKTYPLLTPMSEIAGEVGMLMGVFYSFTYSGGNGKLIGGSPGVEPSKVMILGAGYAGLGAVRYALGLGADVTLVDSNLQKLREVKQQVFPQVKTLYSSRYNISKALPEMDILLNAVKWRPGMTLVSKEMLKLMKKGSLIVDVDCEPNGAIESCRYTTPDDPIYVVEGVRHICIPNLPSAAANTASTSLGNTTLPYVLELAEKGWLQAIQDSDPIRKGLTCAKGYLTIKDTAEAQNRPLTSIEYIVKEFSV